ncbi:MAG: beta-galactosidase trimerization domain-containing protein [Anaerolineae bacterium]|nr:beta-galactosidase trimerization domain-containing protein [Anaerolineae bacterium]
MGDTDRHAWLKRRNRGFHVTIRDVDCRDFDVQRFIDDLASMHATFFSFFVGGYVTTYPTDLVYQRTSPYLGGRDLTGEIIEAAHAADIKALGMIDLGQVPEQAALDHPDWCTQDAGGNPVARLSGLYAACPMGGYQNDYVRDIVAEILSRYNLDCVKFGGGSFGFSRDICYCPNCRRSFRDLTGHELPRRKDWQEPVWRTYTAWRLEQARQRVVRLGEVVRSIDPQMPFMGNSVCFGDPGWTAGASIDVESQAAVADAIQVEIQTRARYDEQTGEAAWQYLSWPAETARFMTSVSDKPVWVVTSYFLAWPWRRTAMAPVEQKVYLAQVPANGADPMVNLSGGPPAVHEDPRGFETIRDLYGFLKAHQEVYEGDTSHANVALVYSLETLIFYGRDDPEKRYVREIRGIERALHEAHIPFDIISTRVLDAETLDRYRVLVLPSLACLSEAEAAAIEAYLARAGTHHRSVGVVATGETSLYDREGVRREDFLLGHRLGVRYLGETVSTMADAEAGIPHRADGYKQVYMQLSDENRHPVLGGFETTSVLPMGGDICLVVPRKDTEVPLTLSAPFIVFPEGFSYPKQPASHHPLMAIKEQPEGGRAVTFTGKLGTLYWTMPYPDLGRLIANMVRWAAVDALPIEVEGPGTLQVSLRRQGDRRMVHLINLTGGERFFRELVPLVDITVRLRVEDGYAVQGASMLSNGEGLSVEARNGFWSFVVPKLTDYDVLVVDLAQT